MKFNFWKQFLSGVVLTLVFSGLTSADVVEFDLQTGTEMSSVDGLLQPLGFDLDQPANNFTTTLAGITFVASTTSTLGDGTSGFNAAGGGSGVNSLDANQAAGDVSSAVDFGEELTFTLTFGPELTKVSLVELDLGGIGDGETAQVSIAGNNFTLEDGFGPEFGDTNSNFTPATPIDLVSGDTIILTGTTDSSFDADGLSIHITTAVPEPSSMAVVGLGSVLMLIRRRR